MTNRWVVNEEFPNGHLVAMTSDEESQLLDDRKAGEVREEAEQNVLAETAAIYDELTAILDVLETTNSNWSTLTNDQKDVALQSVVRSTVLAIQILSERRSFKVNISNGRK